MTNVARTQAPEAQWSVEPQPDPIDLLVPPPRTLRRSLVLMAITALVLVLVVAVANTGLVRPKLGLVPNASYTAAGSTTLPSLAFDVRNDGSFPVSIVGVDARARGLGGARVGVARLGAGGTQAAHGFPLRIAHGDVARITMTFATWNCRAIQLHGSDTVPLHLSGPLGVSTTVSLVPGFHFDPPDAGVLIGAPDENEIGWPAGITWTGCHPGSSDPNAATP